MKASIVVTSYNYGRFLAQAIESALAQTHSETEVIVVDDGSTDGSRRVIDAFGKRIMSVLKENAGQASAFNAGFAASSGEIVLFLDSDDVLLPTAIEQAAERVRPNHVVKAHWPLWEIDERGDRTGQIVPSNRVRGGLLVDELVERGLTEYDWPPTSGNAWARSLLDELLPMPEAEYRTCPDIYLGALARLYGRIEVIAEPQSLYRVHGRNNVNTISYEEERRRLDHVYEALNARLRERGVHVDVESWRADSWVHRLHRAEHELLAAVAPGSRIVVIDGDKLRGEFEHHWRTIPFLGRNDEYWGPPADDEHAIDEFRRLRSSGASHLVVGWPAFWWLDYYTDFAAWLRECFSCVLENDRLVVFDLRSHSGGVR